MSTCFFYSSNLCFDFEFNFEFVSLGSGDFGGGFGGSSLEISSLDTGNLEYYFCPIDDCEGVLLDFLSSANKTLDCAFYDIGLESLQDKLLELYSGPLKLRVITDNDYAHKFFYEEFVKVDGYNYMHDKFCIADSTRVFTGSMNPTDNGAFKNDNNILVIDSKILASNYAAEFEEMWQGEFKGGERVLNPVVSLKLDSSVVNESILVNESLVDEGILIENYFCPEDDCSKHIVEKIQLAEQSIYFMTFSFTHDSIANNILLRYDSGVEVKGIFETRMAGGEYTKYGLFSFQGIDVRKDGNSNTMHHKVFIIDEKIVITGSMNPSSNGDKGNDENLLIIENSKVAAAYLAEFERVFSAGKV